MSDDATKIPVVVSGPNGRCDACFAGSMAWVYTLPPGLDLVRMVDAKTGGTYTPFKSAGRFGLCEECRGILDTRAVRLDVIPECFARRMMNRQPLTKTLDAPRRAFLKRALIVLFKRVLPYLVDVVPEAHVPGADPMEGKAVYGPPGSARDGAPQDPSVEQN